MSNKLRQPHIAAQVCENRPGTLLPAAFKIHKTSTGTGFVVSPCSRSLTATCCCTLARQPPGNEHACTTSGIPPRAVQGLFEWLGIYFEQ